MNPFQAQFPLSPRKFWKKFIPPIFGVILLSIVLAFIVIFISLATGGTTTLPGMINIGILSTVGFTVILLAINAWYYKTYIRTYYYEGGDNFMTIRKGVFTPREIHIQYQKIQDVYVDQDLLDRIMGLYDVHIASATVASGMEAHIDGVEAPIAEGLKQFFLAKIQNGSASMPSAGSIPNAGAPSAVPQFTGSISSDTYPIESSWMIKSIVSIILTSLIFGLFAAFYVWAKNSDNTSLPIPFFPTFLGITVVWFIFHLIGILLWKHNYRYAFLPEYIQFHTGILSQSERHLPYKSIQDVNISRTLLDRMFGLANVTIENAAQMAVASRSNTYGRNSNIMIVGLTPENASAITEQLKSVILTKDSSRMGL